VKGKILSISLILIACQTKKNETFISGSFRVDGIMSQSSKYDGHIKFYDTNTNILLIECDYRNGIKNGEYKEYYKNGTLKMDLFYNEGKENGIIKYFDSSGNLVARDYYYYGLHSGNAIRYSNSKFKSYSFYSLDNKELIHFNYDSLKGKHLPDIFSDFFFYSHVNFIDEINNIAPKKAQYFLYTPNPPLEEFSYSLVKVDKNLKILSTIVEFDKNKPWTTFDYDSNWKTINTSVAIELMISDSINNIDIGMLKVLK
jgi:hypothetical protein